MLSPPHSFIVLSSAQRCLLMRSCQVGLWQPVALPGLCTLMVSASCVSQPLVYKSPTYFDGLFCSMQWLQCSDERTLCIPRAPEAAQLVPTVLSLTSQNLHS